MSVPAKAIEALDLHKSLGGMAVIRGLSLELQEGEIVGLLGDNGAGKTTTLLMLSGALAPDQGEVRIRGIRFRGGDSSLSRFLGYVPQQTAVYPGLTVAENLEFFGGFYPLDREQLKQQIEEALQICGLTERRDQRAGRLSAGLKRRLSLSIALVHRPPILILDEATVGMDSSSRRQVLVNLRALADSGAAILFATHLMDEAEFLCNRIVILEEGKIVDRILGIPDSGKEGTGFSRRDRAPEEAES